MHIYTSSRSFFVFIKITYLQPFREIIGRQTKRQFSTKNDATGQKKRLFSEFFSFVAHLHVEMKLFCYYRNFISSAVMEGDKIALRRQRPASVLQCTRIRLHEEEYVNQHGLRARSGRPTRTTKNSTTGHTKVDLIQPECFCWGILDSRVEYPINHKPAKDDVMHPYRMHGPPGSH